MPTAIQIPVRQTGLEKSIRDAVNHASKTAHINLGTNARQINSLSQPLGKITGQADQFTKSMEAANARVFAFGASVGILGAVTNAFRQLLKNTIEVEKTLTDINSVFQKSTQEIEAFGKGIFDVARSTGQSFKTVADGALELSRQGLSAEESLKRVNDAMILTRLSGLDAKDAVEGLTAAINSYKEAGLSSSQIMNKMVAVAQKYSVSERDLIEAVKRSAAVANQAGVSFDELMGIITAVQEKTARGGAVIGNAFKTIFARVQNKETLTMLQDMGVVVSDLKGEVLPAEQVLKNLSKEFKNLSRLEQADLAKKLGGMYQLSNFLAVIKDMGSESSTAFTAAADSLNATNQAYERNLALNKTLAALINDVTVSYEQLTATLGQIGIADGLKGFINGLSEAFKWVQKILGEESAMGDFARALTKGIGGLLGPGLMIAGAVLIKLMANLVKFGLDSFKAFFGLNKAARELQTVEQSINLALASNLKLQQEIYALEGNRLAQIQKMAMAISQQEAEQRRLAKTSASIAGPLYNVGIRANSGMLRAPNAASGLLPAAAKEKMDINRGVGGAKPTDKPVFIPNFNFGGGKKGSVVANSGEYIIPNFAGTGGSAIFNRHMVQQMGLPKGAKKINAAGGFIPNYEGLSEPRKAALFRSNPEIFKANYPEEYEGRLKAAELNIPFSQYLRKQGNKTAKLDNTLYLDAAGSLGVVSLFADSATQSVRTAQFSKQERSILDSLVGSEILNVELKGIQNKSLQQYSDSSRLKANEQHFRKIIAEKFAHPIMSLGSELIGRPFTNTDMGALSASIQKAGSDPNLLSAGAQGEIFEAAIRIATKSIASLPQFKSDKDFEDNFDFINTGDESSKKFVQSFGFSNQLIKADAKRSGSADALRSIIGKLIRDPMFPAMVSANKVRNMSQGFVPNFASPFIKSRKNLSISGPYTKYSTNAGSILKVYPQIQRGDDRQIRVKYMEAAQGTKGEAFKLFLHLAKLAARAKASIFSDELLPQSDRFEKIFDNEELSNFDKLLKLFPQLRYRMIPGATTKGNLIYPKGQGNVSFETLQELKSHVNKIPESQFAYYFNQGVNDSGVLDVKTTFDNLAKGFVPNFASQNAIAAMQRLLNDPAASIGEKVNAAKFLSKFGATASLGSKSLGGQKISLRQVFDQLDVEDAYVSSLIDKSYVKAGPYGTRNEVFDVFTKEVLANPQKLREVVKAHGFVPNFSNPLSQAIRREMDAGVPASKIYIDQSPTLRNPSNPMGLMVANRIDEPAGGYQGISRAIQEGKNPKTYGASNGLIPNFADLRDSREARRLKLPKAELDELQKDLLKVKQGIMGLSEALDKYEYKVSKAKGSTTLLGSLVENAVNPKAAAIQRERQRRIDTFPAPRVPRSEFLIQDTGLQENSENLSSPNQKAPRDILGTAFALQSVFSMLSAASSDATDGMSRFSNSISSIMQTATTFAMATSAIQSFSTSSNKTMAKIGDFAGKIGIWGAVIAGSITAYKEFGKWMDQSSGIYDSAANSINMMSNAASKAAINLDQLDPEAKKQTEETAKSLFKSLTTQKTTTYVGAYGAAPYKVDQMSNVNFEGFTDEMQKALMSNLQQALGMGVSYQLIESEFSKYKSSGVSKEEFNQFSEWLKSLPLQRKDAEKAWAKLNVTPESDIGQFLLSEENQNKIKETGVWNDTSRFGKWQPQALAIKNALAGTTGDMGSEALKSLLGQFVEQLKAAADIPEKEQAEFAASNTSALSKLAQKFPIEQAILKSSMGFADIQRDAELNNLKKIQEISLDLSLTEAQRAKKIKEAETSYEIQKRNLEDQAALTQKIQEGVSNLSENMRATLSQEDVFKSISPFVQNMIGSPASVGVLANMGVEGRRSELNSLLQNDPRLIEKQLNTNQTIIDATIVLIESMLLKRQEELDSLNRINTASQENNKLEQKRLSITERRRVEDERINKALEYRLKFESTKNDMAFQRETANMDIRKEAELLRLERGGASDYQSFLNKQEEINNRYMMLQDEAEQRKAARDLDLELKRELYTLQNIQALQQNTTATQELKDAIQNNEFGNENIASMYGNFDTTSKLDTGKSVLDLFNLVNPKFLQDKNLNAENAFDVALKYAAGLSGGPELQTSLASAMSNRYLGEKQLSEQALLNIDERNATSSLNALKNAPKTFSEGMRDAFRNLDEEVRNFEYNFATSIPKRFSDAMTEGIMRVIDKTDDLKGAFRSVAYDFVKEMNRQLLSNMMNGFIGSFRPSANNTSQGSGLSFVSSILEKIPFFTKKANGGVITGGSGTKDDIPALLTGGEFVVKKSAVQKYGPSLLHAINNESLGKYARGGVAQKGPRTNFYMPGIYGQGEIVGMNNLLGYASQGYTNPSKDKIRKNFINISPESVALTNKARMSREGLIGLNRDAKKSAFSLFVQEMRSIQEAKKAAKKQKTALYRQLGMMALMAVGTAGAAGAFNAASMTSGGIGAKTMAGFKGTWGGFGGYGGLRNIFSGTGFKFGFPKGIIQQESSLSAFNQIASSSNISSIRGVLGVGPQEDVPLNSSPIQEHGVLPRLNFNHSHLDKLNPFDIQEFATGGNLKKTSGIDTIPTMLSGGEFIMNRAATQAIGSGNLAALNAGASSMVTEETSEKLNEKLLAKLDELIEKMTGGTNIEINIDGSGRTSQTSSGGNNQGAQQLARQIKDVVIKVLEDQKRLGGSLRRA